jgi:hypothetical protein
MRNSALTAKIEVTEGVDVSPAPATDAIRIEKPQLKPVVKTQTTEESSGSLDTAAPIVGGAYMEFTCTVYGKGSGTPATAPEWATLLKICGYAETIVAAAIPAAPEACAAGGSTTTAVLGATAAGTLQLYRGAPVVFTGTVALTTAITDYTAAKTATLGSTATAAIVATTNYQIPVHVRYTPTSAAAPSATLYLYEDGIRYRLVGCRGDAKFSLTANGTLKIDFTIRGMLLDKADISMPTTFVYQPTTKPIWKGNAMYVGQKTAAVSNASFQLGNKLTNPDDPNQTQGFMPAIITARNITGTIDPLMTLVATRNSLSDLLSSVQQSLYLALGSVSGNRIVMTMPLIQHTGVDDTDREGVLAETLNFQNCVNDAGLIIAIY